MPGNNGTARGQWFALWTTQPHTPADSWAKFPLYADSSRKLSRNTMPGSSISTWTMAVKGSTKPSRTRNNSCKTQGETVDPEFQNAAYRVDLMISLIEPLFAYEEGKQPSKQTLAVRGALEIIFEIAAKYQVPDSDFVDNLSIEDLERDMYQLTSLSFITGIVAAKAQAGSKHFYALGKKKGAEAVLQERSRCVVEKEKFSAAAADYLSEQQKGSYGISEARAQAEGSALEQITDISDRLCQVLKKIHERKVRELMSNLPGA